MKIALPTLPLLSSLLAVVAPTHSTYADIVPFPTVVESDVCVYGGTSGGVIAAVEAARMGKSVVLVVFNNHLGGMTSGGLGQTDVGSNGTTYIQGLSREFYTRISQKYGGSTAQFTFEPHVAESVFNEMVQQAGVAVYYNEPLTSVTKQGAAITNITAQDGTIFRAGVFIDASYEGDLMATAGVSYTVGRESNSQYGETLNGTRAPNTGGHQFGTLSVDPYVTPGDSTSGLIPLVQPGATGTAGQGDQLLEAYNYRICFTTTAANKNPITAPPDYDPANYELLARYIEARVARGDTLSLTSFMNIGAMPTGKTDINNNGAVSTDFIGQSAAYPEAAYSTRAQIAQAHLYYTEGFFYFLASSPRVPSTVRTAMQSYGLCKDEFTDNGGWPNQLYVREARRMISDYVMTQANCTGGTVASDSIGLASYTMDAHNAERIVAGGVAQNEGDVEQSVSKPYPIAYRAIVPKASECTNLIVPWSLSASHTGFSSIRMEPVFMIIGQAAGTAASIAVDDNATVQNVSYAKLAAQLAADGQALAPGSGPGNPAIVVDNADSTGVTIAGAWTTSTSTQGYYGANYIHDGNTGQGTKSVQFTPTLPSTGTYQVFLHWTADTNRATNIPVDIMNSGGATTVTINEQAQGGQWVSLGTYPFNAGTVGSVKIRTTGANGYVVADAAGFTSGTAVPTVNLWATDSSAAEPLASTGAPRTGKVMVSRSGDTTNALTVNLSIGGSATNGVDYSSIPNSIVIAAGATTVSITITPLPDNAVEGPETVVVSPAASANYTIGSPGSATITIQDRPIDNWRHSVFTPAQLADTTNNPTADGADPENDGVSNLLKYVSGRNPNAVSTSSVATQGTTRIGTSDYQTLTYTKIKGSTDTSAFAEVSGDLSSWASDVSSVQQTIIADDGQTQTIVARDLTPLQSGGRRFIRLRALRAQ